MRPTNERQERRQREKAIPFFLRPFRDAYNGLNNAVTALIIGNLIQTLDNQDNITRR